MHILHVSLGLPPYRSGGLTKYSIDLMLEQVRQSHAVSLLYPGCSSLRRRVEIVPNPEHEGIRVFEIVNPLPVPLMGGIRDPERFTAPGDRSAYERFLSGLRPDVIHVHTLMGVHREFFEAARALGIRMVCTSHDYFGICPRVSLMDRRGEVCEDYAGGSRCVSCNADGYSPFKIMVMQSKLYRRFKESALLRKVRQIEKDSDAQAALPEASAGPETAGTATGEQYAALREYYKSIFGLIDSMHFNSTLARDEFGKHMPVRGTVIPITHGGIRDHRLRKKYDPAQPLQICYLGPIAPYKGFYLLSRVLGRMRGGNWHLHVYGDTVKDGLDTDPAHYSYHGKYKHDDLERIFASIDLIVVPSIWKETFGFVGLEALSYGVPIAVSERVGLRDLVVNGETGFVFEPDEAELESLLRALIADREALARVNRRLLEQDFIATVEHHARAMLGFYRSDARTDERGRRFEYS